MNEEGLTSMKLAFSTLPCEGWTIDEWIEACKQYGFAGIELKEDMGYAVTMHMSDDELLRAADKFRAAGIAVTDIGSRVVITGVEPDGTALQLALQRNIQLAQLLGARGVRIMLGNFFKVKPDPPLPLDRERIVRHLQDACDYAADRQVDIWIETHNEFSTGAVLRELLDEVGRANCKVVYDILHPYEFGEAPADTVRLLGSACAHVHVKDGVPDPDPNVIDWKYTLTGAGELPIASIVQELEQSGYDGYFSLEWEPKWRPELRELNADTHDVLEDYVAYMSKLGGMRS
jgi:sugar phosphate isomerase/epimerase